MSLDIFAILAIWGCFQVAFSLWSGDTTYMESKFIWLVNIVALASLICCIFVPDVWAELTQPVRIFIQRNFTLRT